MIITFNAGLSTDSNEFGTFIEWVRNVAGDENVDQIIENSPVELTHFALWKLTTSTSKDRSLKPIGKPFGLLGTNKDLILGNTEYIVGVMSGEDTGKQFKDLVTEFKTVDSGMTVYWILKAKHHVIKLLASDVSAYKISQVTGVAESSIKTYRKRSKVESLDFMPLGNLLKLMSYYDKEKPHD